jgi:hypothetical protein
MVTILQISIQIDLQKLQFNFSESQKYKVGCVFYIADFFVKFDYLGFQFTTSILPLRH